MIAGTGGGNQLPDTGNVALSGGMLAYTANSSAGVSPATGLPTVGESLGALLLNPGHSEVVLSNAGSGTAYLLFASGTPHTAGATLGFSAGGGQIEFLANPPPLVNGILPYSFYGPVNSTTVDFATLSTSAGVTLVSALAYSGSTTGNIGSMAPNGALNLAATGTQSAITFADAVNSLKLAGVGSLAMSGTGSLVLDSGGLICTGTPSASSTISGGTLSAPGGELVINTATNLIVSSLLSASAALTKTGTGTLTLTAANSLLGSTFINQGTLAYAPTANFSYGGAISGAGNLLMAGTGAMLTLSGTSAYSGSTTVTAGTLCVNGSLAGGGVNLPGGGVVSGSGSILGNVTVTGGSIAQNASLNIAGNVTVNSGALTIGPAGVGHVTVGGGINVGGSGALVAASTAAALSGNLNYTSSANSTYSGAIVGANSCVTFDSPAGAALTLSGSNPYGGGTLLEGGTLRTNNAAALGSGGLLISGGTLDLDGSPSLKIASLTGAGGVITNSASGTATLTVSPASGCITSFSGTIINGVGAVALALSGPAGGGLIVSGSDSYTGGTTVSGDTLWVTSALPAGTSLAVGAGGTFVFDPAAAPSLGSASAVESSALAVTPVPEPGTAVLLLVALCSAAACRRFFVFSSAGSSEAADPCRLARPVNESCQRRGLSRILSRPLPACLAGEQVFWRGGIIAIKTPSPARRAGRGRRHFGKTRSFAKKTPSPARQAGRGQTPSRVVKSGGDHDYMVPSPHSK